MKSRRNLVLVSSFAVVMTVALADDLDFEGHDLVEPDCDAMSSWFECRDIDTAPPDVFLGYLYMHHTSETLGPDGNTVYADTGEPYVTTVTACSSCHFTGGHVPLGSPVYQSPSKYQPDPVTGLGPYFRPLGYHRDLEDSIIDCFRNCMNAERAPAKDDPVMVALVDYIHWVSDGIIDPAMRADWNLLPPEAGPRLPAIAGVATMRADPLRGEVLYAGSCADCHSEDAPGQGEYRVGEERPRIPALWGLRDGYSKGAAFYRTPVLAAYVQKHMPYDDPETLSNQDALDIAAFLNAPDKPRGSGMADVMYCHDDADGIPSALRKPADWLVGCEYPGERLFFENQGIHYDDMVLNGPWDALAAWRAAEVSRLLACGSTQNFCTSTPNSSGLPASIGSLGSNSIAAQNFTLTCSNGPAGQFGIFFYGPDQIQVPLGDGFRCVGGAFLRTDIVQTDASGSAALAFDFAAAPTITAGVTHNFQFWFRDGAGPGGTGVNLTDGLQVTFCE